MLVTGDLSSLALNGEQASDMMSPPATMDNTMDIVESGVVSLTIADAKNKDAAKESMKQVRAEVIFAEKAVMEKGKRDDETIALLENARAKLTEIEMKRKRHEAQVKLKEMSLFCGQLPWADLEKIFPEEVWEAVLNRLEDKERYDVARWSDLFKAQVANFRAVDLFPQVFPHIYKYLDEIGVHSCRLVNKKWKAGIDNYLNQGCFEFEERSFRADVVAPSPGKFVGPRYCQVAFNNFDENNTKLRDFNESYGTKILVDDDALAPHPFISRTLLLMGMSIQDENVDRDFWLEAKQTLKVHGRKLWHLRLIFAHGTADFVFVWELICSLLQFTPNLKSLEISHRCLTPVDLQEWNLRMGKTQMGSRFSENLLPRLNNLRHLRVRQILNSVLNLLLKKYGGQLEKLEACPFPSDELDFAGGSLFPNLRYYCHVTLAEADDWGSDFDCTTIGIRQVQCRLLERIRLIVEFGSCPSCGGNIPNVSTMLERASSFNKSVRHMELCLFTGGGSVRKVNAAVGVTTFLQLPKLEMFSLVVRKVNLNTIDFLLPCRSLKQLTLIYLKKPIEEGEEKNVKKKKTSATAGDSVSSRKEIILFKDYTTKLYESNIWSIFPYLEMVKIEVDRVTPARNGSHFHLVSSKTKVYTREGYIGNSIVT